jgi:hypothetical protein
VHHAIELVKVAQLLAVKARGKMLKQPETGKAEIMTDGKEFEESLSHRVSTRMGMSID